MNGLWKTGRHPKQCRVLIIMKILVVQESDWLQRNPSTAPSHGGMSLRGHEIRVIDYEINWKTNNNPVLTVKREIFKGVHKIHDEARVDVVRPSFIKITVLNYLSWVWTNYWKSTADQGISTRCYHCFWLLNAYIASKAAKKHKIPFVYYLIDVLYNLILKNRSNPSVKRLKNHH
jgi:hypothetical protein